MTRKMIITRSGRDYFARWSTFKTCAFDPFGLATTRKEAMRKLMEASKNAAIT